MKRTLSIPIDLPKAPFLTLMGMCAQIFNKHVEWAYENKTYNKNRAHKDLYYPLREQYPNIPSALIQTVRDTAMEAIKAQKFKKRPCKKATSALRYDKRTMTLRGKQLTLSCIGKRHQVILQIPPYFEEVFQTWRFVGSTLVYNRRKRQFFFHLVFEKEDPPLEEGEVQGIDRGIHHIAVTSDATFYSNKHVRASQRRYLYNRRTLQAKGTPSAKRRLKAMAGREKRFSKDVNHVVSKRLVQQERVGVLVLEDLSGIRNKRRNKKSNKRIASWPFYQLSCFLEYKAKGVGKRVAYVDARYTSQRCSQCGSTHSSYRKKSRFRCGTCGFCDHADVNAAKNIRNNFLLSQLSLLEGTVGQAAVNLPYVTSA